MISLLGDAVENGAKEIVIGQRSVIYRFLQRVTRTADHTSEACRGIGVAAVQMDAPQSVAGLQDKVVMQADVGVIGGRYLADKCFKFFFCTAGLAQVQAVESVVEKLSQYFGFVRQKVRGCEDNDSHKLISKEMTERTLPTSDMPTTGSFDSFVHIEFGLSDRFRQRKSVS